MLRILLLSTLPSIVLALTPDPWRWTSCLFMLADVLILRELLILNDRGASVERPPNSTARGARHAPCPLCGSAS